MGRQKGLVGAVGANQHVERHARRHAQLGADVAHGHDDALQEFHVRHGRFVLALGADLGVGTRRQALGIQGRDARPDFLGHEGDDRMGDDHDLRKHVLQARPGRGLGRLVLAVQFGLDELKVPVTELAPDKGVDALGGLVEAVAFDLGRVFLLEHLETMQDPAVMQSLQGRRVELRFAPVHVHEGEAGRVPNLVDEMPVALDARLGQLDVAAHGGEGGQGETQGIAAVPVDHLQGVDDVARGLGHLLAVLVADEGVDVDVLEGHVVHELQAHHHHAGHPEEEDVEARDQERRRVEGRQLMRLLWPGFY